jgi:hypothetical protein
MLLGREMGKGLGLARFSASEFWWIGFSCREPRRRTFEESNFSMLSCVANKQGLSPPRVPCLGRAEIAHLKSPHIPYRACQRDSSTSRVGVEARTDSIKKEIRRPHGRRTGRATSNLHVLSNAHEPTQTGDSRITGCPRSRCACRARSCACPARTHRVAGRPNSWALSTVAGAGRVRSTSMALREPFRQTTGSAEILGPQYGRSKVT